jgi:hypothetical protein
MEEMRCTQKILLGNFMETNHFRKLDIDGRSQLELTSEEQNGKA